MWIFGYGSLTWRPGFAWRERRVGRVTGWARRFYQGSPDHRGTEEAPGRVVTLLEAPGETCWGVAYRVEAAEARRVLGALDVREQGGYARADLVVATGAARTVEATAYLATPDNPSWLGPDTPARMAAHIRSAAGPSGTNLDYLLRLGRFLREVGVDEPHVFGLVRQVRALNAPPRRRGSGRSAGGRRG